MPLFGRCLGPRFGVLAVAAAALLVLAGCRALPGLPARPTPTPTPLEAARRWGAETVSYRYERTTLAQAPDGTTTVVQENGEVVLPDRQWVRLRARTGAGEEANELLVVGDRVWLRRAILGGGWEEARGGAPPDPLTVALGTLAAAGPPRDAGDRSEADGRLCRGWAYVVDLARAPAWPAAPDGGRRTAEAVLWVEADGAICGQIMRVERDGRPEAEYTVVFKDVDAPIAIEPPN